jgi:FtsZ-binding cell division protein ZapB
MKAEVRADLSTINSKVDDISNTVNLLKTENESLKQENQEMKKQIHSLCSKIDSLEGHSRRNNLRFLGIPGTSGEKWEETELKVRHFINDTLGLPDLEHVEIERAHRVGNKNSEKPQIVAKFSRYKDRETILKKSREVLDRNSQFSVREDFTERVQLHRRELGKRLVQARSQGQYASLRFDKLFIDNEVYQYDDLTGEITKIGNTRGRQHTRTNNSQRNVVRGDYREGSEAERSDDESEAGATGGVE